MELIPILSTIILVATISTFMLAIGAYILYKVRERKGQSVVAPQPSEVKAELVTPASVLSAHPSEQQRAVQQQVHVERQPIIIQQQMPQGPAPMQSKFSPKPQPYAVYGQSYNAGSSQQRQFAQPVNNQQRSFQGQRSGNQSSSERSSRESKFMKYTTEGYVPTKDDKDAGALKWR